MLSGHCGHGLRGGGGGRGGRGRSTWGPRPRQRIYLFYYKRTHAASPLFRRSKGSKKGGYRHLRNQVSWDPQCFYASLPTMLREKKQATPEPLTPRGLRDTAFFVSRGLKGGRTGKTYLRRNNFLCTNSSSPKLCSSAHRTAISLCLYLRCCGNDADTGMLGLVPKREHFGWGLMLTKSYIMFLTGHRSSLSFCD